ncbi:hypothetical protein J7L67_09145, partial [bacterium]|nr:hypothetical protein [bacterium]
ILTRNFLPYYQSVGGVLRVLKIARYLYEHGFDIHILAARGLKIDYFGYEKDLRNYNIHYFNDFLKKIENKVFLNSLNSQGLDAEYTNLKLKIKKAVSYFMIPDQTVLSVGNAYKQAKNIIEKNQIENVIVSSPPQSILLAGYALKKHFSDKINFIIDYRDSWNTTAIFRKTNPVLSALCKRTERKILKIADRFVYVSAPMIDKIENLYVLKGLKQKSCLIMNGFKTDKLDFSYNSQSKSGKIKIGYFGAISDAQSSFRDPTLLLEYIKKNYNDVFEIFIYGSQNINGKYHFVKSFAGIAHAKALNIMKQMDLLLLIHTKREGADEVITGKFFDYLTAGRPLLAYTPLNMEAAKLIRDYKVGYNLGILPENEGHLKFTIDTIIDQFKSNNLLKYTPDRIKELSCEAQFRKFLDILR